MVDTKQKIVGAPKLADMYGVRVQTVYYWIDQGLPCVLTERERDKHEFTLKEVQVWLDGRYRRTPNKS